MMACHPVLGFIVQNWTGNLCMTDSMAGMLKSLPGRCRSNFALPERFEFLHAALHCCLAASGMRSAAIMFTAYPASVHYD